MANFVGLIDSILDKPKRLLPLLAIAAVISLGVIATAWAIARIFGLNQQAIRELRFGATGAQVLLEGRERGSSISVVAVDPHGWQLATGLELNLGDQVQFEASGRVHVDVTAINESARARRAIEDIIVKQRQLDRTSLKPEMVPERFFKELDPSLQAQLTAPRPWTGPDGVVVDPLPPGSFAGRIAKRLIPGEPLGKLLAAFVPRGQKQAPAAADAFVVGSSAHRTVAVASDLWFTVNNVWDGDNPEYPNRFYDDNAGMYWVKVRVTAR